MITDEGEDVLVFLPEQAKGTGNLSPEEDEIELETLTNSVVFEYIPGFVQIDMSKMGIQK